MANDPIKRTVLDVTAAYRAGMKLPPLQRQVCPDCREVYDDDLGHDFCPVREGKADRWLTGLMNRGHREEL